MSRLSDELHKALDEVERLVHLASDIRHRRLGVDAEGDPVKVAVEHAEGPVKAIIDHLGTVRTHVDNVHVKYADEPTSKDLNDGKAAAAAAAVPVTAPASAAPEGA